jgi:acetyl esterase/lipase
MKLLLTLSLSALSLIPALAAEPEVLKLWPEGAPGQMILKPAAPGTAPNPNVITGITDPTLTMYRPEKPNGTVVIVAPGGGYRFLSIKNEGSAVCEFLNTIGVTAALLTYRTPTNEEPVPYDKPVQDAQRAIGLLRHRAAAEHIERIGLLGFSAGGNLLGRAAFDRVPRTYPVKPELDDQNFRPDFIVMVYGGGFLDPADKTKFREGFSVPDDAPPAFFVVAHDDKSNPIEAAMVYLEYKKKNLPAELHIYTQGGHGFGMRKESHPINDWPQRVADWMVAMGYAPGAVKP